MLRQPITRALQHCTPSTLNAPGRQFHCLLKRPPGPGARPLPLRVPRANPPHQQRNIFTNFRRRVEYERKTGNWRSLHVPLVAAILTTTVGLLLIVYGYTMYQDWVARTLHNFPPSVAKELRRALYYSRSPGSSSYSPKDAIRHFVAALEKAKAEGMHPLSREVTGIKIEIARVLEECGRKDKAAEVLEEVWNSLRRGVEVWDARVKEGSDNASMKTASLKQGEGNVSQEAIPEAVDLEQRTAELERERTELARRTVETGVKLGSLLLEDWPENQSQTVQFGEKKRKQEAERVLEKTVATIIAEERRREEKRKSKKELPGATESVEEDGWLKPIEVASAFEILATHYLTTNRPHLATPLLMHAINTLYPRHTPDALDDPERLCHAATLMNTISVAIAELPPSTQMRETGTSPDQQPSPTAAAEYWANLARGLTSLKPDASPELRQILRSEECRQAHVTALINLAELRRHRGDVEAARTMFERARKEAGNVGWEDGVRRAEDALRSLEGER